MVVGEVGPEAAAEAGFAEGFKGLFGVGVELALGEEGGGEERGWVGVGEGVAEEEEGDEGVAEAKTAEVLREEEEGVGEGGDGEACLDGGFD